MLNLKVRVYKQGQPEPESTVTVPYGAFKVASRLLPMRAADALRQKGVDVDELARLADDPNARGTLVEYENHKDNEKIVVSLE